MSWYERHIFNRVLDRGMDKEEFHAIRRRLLAGVDGRVLEIGIGTGLNLSNYPKRVRRISSLSLDEQLSDRAQRRAEDAGMKIDHHAGDGSAFPFEDHAFDSIVCTLTLCSVRDPRGVISEMARTLAPDGRVFLWEHVLGRTPLRRRVQRLVNPLQRFCGCGCTLTRDTRRSIEDGGFVFDWIEEFECTQMPWAARDIIVSCCQYRHPTP